MGVIGPYKDAGIKLESVVSDVMGKASRRMLDALIAGERDATLSWPTWP
jgi:hypothetical protein